MLTYAFIYLTRLRHGVDSRLQDLTSSGHAFPSLDTTEACICAHKTNLTSPLFIQVPSRKSEQSCICVLGVSRFPLFLICFCWTLELFRRCGIFAFHLS